MTEPWKSRGLIILHDWDGRPYFSALEKWAESNGLAAPIYRESSVVFLLIRSLAKGSFTLNVLARTLRNCFFRLCVPFISGKTVIMGLAPYDLRLLWYGQLAFRNRVILHTSWPYWWSDRVPRSYGPFRGFSSRIYEQMLKRLPIYRVVCVTDASHRSILSRQIPGLARKLSVIPHSVDTKVFSPQSGGEAAPSRLKVLFVGRMTEEKGVDLFAEIAIKCRAEAYDFVLIGTGPRRAEVESRLNSLPNVTFRGHVQSTVEMATSLREADVLVSPARRVRGWEELFGIAILEAMSCGLVVVASRHVGPEELIDSACNGILLPDDASADIYIEELERLRKDPSERRRLGANARFRAMDYSVQKNAQKWAEILNG